MGGWTDEEVRSGESLRFDRGGLRRRFVYGGGHFGWTCVLRCYIVVRIWRSRE